MKIQSAKTLKKATVEAVPIKTRLTKTLKNKVEAAKLKIEAC